MVLPITPRWSCYQERFRRLRVALQTFAVIEQIANEKSGRWRSASTSSALLSLSESGAL